MGSNPTRSVDYKFSEALTLRKLNYASAPIVVGERYELLNRIGSGGFGTVYEAHDPKFDRRVAVKILDLSDRDMAMREGQLLAKLAHPNIVMIFEAGVGPDYRYFVLQLLEGPTLRSWCRGKPPAAIILKFVEAANGLAEVHARGLVHRDFKPSNVRIGPLGQAVLVDFGLARQIHTLNGDPEQIGLFEGTLDYAPPERLLGSAGDERSDQFSLCVALWEALSGVNPFGACTRATTCEARFHATSRDLLGTPRAPPYVLRALRRGLSFQPGERFPNMGALVAALAPKPRRWRWQELLVAGISVIAIAGLLTQLMPSRDKAALEFVASARASWSGQVAIAAARAGNVDGAMWRLEEAMRADLGQETSRKLALDCEAVASEFERHALYQDALIAWQFAILFARDAVDLTIEQRSRQRLDAAHGVLRSARR